MAPHGGDCGHYFSIPCISALPPHSHPLVFSSVLTTGEGLVPATLSVDLSALTNIVSSRNVCLCRAWTNKRELASYKITIL